MEKSQDNIKLKRCPFCGSDVEYTKFNQWRHYINCLGCSASISSSTKKKVYQIWDIRCEV